MVLGLSEPKRRISEVYARCAEGKRVVIGNTSGNDVGIIVRGGWFTHIVDDLPLPEVGPYGIRFRRDQ